MLAIVIAGVTYFVIRRRRSHRQKVQDDPQDPDGGLISGRLGIKDQMTKDDTELDSFSQMPRIRYPDPDDFNGHQAGGRTRFEY